MKEIGEFFRENFEGAESTPPSHIWENISKDSALKKYNRMQWVKRGAWYGSAVMTVVLTTALFFMNRNIESTPVVQKNPVIVSKTVEEDKESITFEDVTTSPHLLQTTPETANNPTEPADHKVAIVSPSAASPSNPIPKTEEQKVIEKEQPVTISVPSVKNAVTNPVIHHVTLPNIPIEKREKNEEEKYYANPAQETETAVYPALHIPNAFTPNSDGLNDLFSVYASAKISDYEIYISDRSGQLMYHSKQIETGWDGTCRGEPAPQGVYMYVITFTGAEKKKMTEQGSVLLIR